MPYLIYGFLLLAGFVFWGAGLALLVTPRRYRRFALVFAPVAGLSLQSLVVWLGAYAGLRGTDAYGRAALVLPGVLLAAGWWAWRRRRSGVRGERVKLAGFGALGALMAVQLVVMLVPSLWSGRELTTVSVGNLDAADYGAGARVLQEFAHGDRAGFIGQKEVVSVGVADNFYDFWLRTNHFTPSALIALNGSVLGLRPHELTGLITVVFLVAVCPMVFWLTRAGLRYRSGPSLLITAIYAFNPVNWYAVYNVATAQLLAANAIALLTWCGVALWREGRARAGTGGWRWAGLLGVAYGLIFGSYNFIIIVCLAPAAAYAGGIALREKRWAQLGRWSVLMAVPLAVAGAVYAQRSLGVVERLLLFRTGFGWNIPLLTPEGWLGVVDGVWLAAHAGWWRTGAAVAAGVLIVLPWAAGARRKGATVWLAVCLTAPVLAGYAFFHYRNHLLGNNASYEAYKLFAVFYPGMLGAFCFWLGRGWDVRRWRGAAAAGAAVLLGLNVLGEWRLFYRLLTPYATVDRGLVALGAIETMPDVASVNMRADDAWVRLWANAYLLKKQQYFEADCYEGRRGTALRGEWDLVGNFFIFDLPDAGDSRHPSPGYTLLRRASPCFAEGAFTEGWAETVRDDPRRTPRTRWVGDAAGSVKLHNPQPVPLRADLRARLRALGPRDCEIVIGGDVAARLTLGAEPQVWEQAGVLLPPGETVLVFRTAAPPDLVGGRLKRPVSVAVDGIDVRIRGRAHQD